MFEYKNILKKFILDVLLFISFIIVISFIVGYINFILDRSKIDPYVWIDGKCSGTVISDEYIITAAHCSGYIGQELTIISGNFFISGKVYKRDIFIDISIVRGDFSDFRRIKISNKNPKSGEKYIGIGYPSSLGIKSQIDMVYGEEKSIQKFGTMDWYTGLVAGGFSGGPVLNKKNEIVGIISVGSSSGPLIGSVRLKDIREVLDLWGIFM